MLEDTMMCQDSTRPLSFETMLSDPLVLLLMEADGVSVAELVAVMQIARDGMIAREHLAVRRALSAPPAMSGRA